MREKFIKFKAIFIVTSICSVCLIVLIGFQNCASNSSFQSPNAPNGADPSQGGLSTPEPSSVEISISSTTPPLTAQATIQLSFSVPESQKHSLTQFECVFNLVTLSSCVSPLTFNNLADGFHSLTVRALNSKRTAMLGEKSMTWKIDLTAPQVLINSGPATITASKRSELRFTTTDNNSVGSIFCSLDNATPAVCTSPFIQDNLSLGDHAFRVYAVDSVGNTSSVVEHLWAIKAAPEIEFSTTPLEITKSLNALLEFTVSDPPGAPIIVECSLDFNSFAACTSPISLEGLSNGQHRLTVRAKNRFNITSERTYSWIVDSVAPTISTNKNAYSNTIYSNYAGLNLVINATDINGLANPPECSINKEIFIPCGSSTVFNELSSTIPTALSVRASDRAGNVATLDLNILVDSIFPTSKIVFDKTLFNKRAWNEYTTKEGSFQFSIDYKDDKLLAHFSCSLNNNQITPCNPNQAFNYSNLPDGIYAFEIRGTDGAGNSTSSEGSVTFIIDRTAPSLSANFTLSSAIPFTAPPVVSWEDSTDAVSGIRYYEVSVTSGSVADSGVLMNWTTAGQSLQKQLIWETMTNDQTFFVHLRAVDHTLNKSTIQSIGPFQLSGTFQPNYRKVVTPSNSSSGISACALINDALQCWGGNSYTAMMNNESTSFLNGAAYYPQTLFAKDIKDACVGSASCVLTTSGAVKCWGKNVYGETGEATSTQRTKSPVTVISSGAEAIACIEYNSCAKLAGGKLACWGTQNYGLIGNLTKPSFTPVTLFETGVTDFSIGVSSCAIVSGSLYCWGLNQYGQLGDGTTTTRLNPIKVLDGNVTDFSFDHLSQRVCAVQNGALKCWGRSHNGDGTIQMRTSPVVIIATAVSKVKLSSPGGCAKVNEDLHCWDSANLSPRIVNVEKPIQDFYSGGAQCSLSTAGKLQCWSSSNNSGEVGNGTRSPQVQPYAVFASGVKSFADNFTNQAVACATLATGIHCWGANTFSNGGNVSAIGSGQIPQEYNVFQYYSSPQKIFPQ